MAEWLVCTLHILLSEKRIRGWKAPVLILGALPVLWVLNEAHAGQPGLIWVLVMISCLLSMLLYLRLGIREDNSRLLVRWCHALMQAEFGAALAYLVVVFLVSLDLLAFPALHLYRVIMLLCYAVVYTPLGFLIYKREHRTERPLKASYRDLIASFAIAIGAFVLSNISFLLPDSIFGTSMGGGILFVRTISDFSGMMALFAMEEFSYAMRMKINVSVLESMLEHQYAQYQQFKVNNDQMQQVYHDVKHLIQYIRSVSVSHKYDEALKNMEDAVNDYEAQYDTGNPVLDVMLSGKKTLCTSRQIRMECYVDGQGMDFMDAAHICTIFGNALDNAIEYESKIDDPEKRLIKVSVFSENHFLMIHISNYCEQLVLTEEELPETTKPNPEMHGFGIKGIRLAAEKYRGHMTLKQENNWFIVSILIPIPETRPREEA